MWFLRFWVFAPAVGLSFCYVERRWYLWRRRLLPSFLRSQRVVKLKARDSNKKLVVCPGKVTIRYVPNFLPFFCAVGQGSRMEGRILFQWILQGWNAAFHSETFRLAATSETGWNKRRWLPRAVQENRQGSRAARTLHSKMEKREPIYGMASTEAGKSE